MDKWPKRQNGGTHCHRPECREKKFKKEEKDSLRDLWDNIKCTNIHIRGLSEGEERKDLRKYWKR